MTFDYVFFQTKLKNVYECTEKGLGKKNKKNNSREFLIWAIAKHIRDY